MIYSLKSIFWRFSYEFMLFFICAKLMNNLIARIKLLDLAQLFIINNNDSLSIEFTNDIFSLSIWVIDKK